jgi:hypothetical protein
MKEIEKLGFKRMYNFKEENDIVTFEAYYTSSYFNIDVQVKYKKTGLVDVKACDCNVGCCGSYIGEDIPINEIRQTILEYIREYIEDNGATYIMEELFKEHQQILYDDVYEELKLQTDN